MKLLSERQIVLMHEQLIRATGGADGIRDEGLLEAAVFAPYQTLGDTELFPSIEEKAARLGFGLVKNHAFTDGNKRIGAHAMLVFLALNGVDVTYTQKELSDIILQIASGEREYADLLLWIRTHTTG
ncbi:MAG: type II toxin-antitoxin system death-on-curing family toxin [Clostridia bacterium]|nr:type II toxin-antitoxin system death-on-curing family toxin [Clostridia bacterium]MBR5364749.1 type II toxin-antitoxin system death-on-curing family toxin [Clostridia bacterium]